MDDFEAIQKIIEIASNPNVGTSTGILAICFLGQISIRQYLGLREIRGTQKKYKAAFREFELNIEPLLRQHKVPQPVRSELQRFMTKTRLIFEGLT